ncbi:MULTISPECIES: ABC transporter ATP-binding protein [Bacillus]|jgi:iron complex transport system ATP-binding protein|uniref:ABC transporter ATP-binding protein n=1 Tax=Bacillus toyonensis TaxID=155322 RepID=A0AB36SXK7_9BACI|nr:MULTISPECIES: ABC transporter ATP-binding protein [Bacillus]AFU15246.1 iron compound ABC transporter, ATP-binding protein [Bacillus thuringiensis MC28]KAB0446830.1 ABC transporter ATP-binding protein [Lysinibacillus sp. VIA-II-2016]OFC96709.1 Fe(3+)-citrate import ATP-binding protein YfmF [Bacillus thuringiensis]OTW74800.1 iron ABC transporter ATP-binding protein [Bacillus thuringiensis serovar cameroun]PKR93859.1 CvpA [Bacillus cereus Rock4-18]
MEIKNVTFSYDNVTNRLKSVSSEIEIGKITTIIGPNGCGKSTLLSVMSRNHAPSSGEVILDGKAISEYKPKEFARKLAVVHQQNEAPADITVEKLISFGRMPYKNIFSPQTDEDREAIERALVCTNLQSKRDKPIYALSGGERQRVWIAMTLAQNTPMLFLDEPTTYLDIYYQIEILELVKELNEVYGLTIVMVLHDINQAIRYSDHIIVMKDGEIVTKGNPNDVITEEMVKAIYGVDVVVKQDEDTGLYMVPMGI